VARFLVRHRRGHRRHRATGLVRERLKLRSTPSGPRCGRHRPSAQPAIPSNKGRQARLLSYHVLPLHLQVGDRFSDLTGEWEIAHRPYSTVGGKSVHASVRRVNQPATVEDRTWVAHERIRVRAARQEPRTRSA
jgi:hypothetical protein